MDYTEIESPVGSLLPAASDRGLCLLSFLASRRAVHPQPDWTRKKARFTETFRQLRAYFRGELTEFDLPLALDGTLFQCRVWHAVRAVPYGQTISYGQLARGIGQPTAVRAAGLANGSNPVSIIVPCHRMRLNQNVPVRPAD